MNAAQVLRVPDGLSLRHAALAEPMAVVLHGMALIAFANADDEVLRAALIGMAAEDRAAWERDRSLREEDEAAMAELIARLKDGDAPVDG